jgi:hypothetical protein
LLFLLCCIRVILSCINFAFCAFSSIVFGLSTPVGELLFRCNASASSKLLLFWTKGRRVCFIFLSEGDFETDLSVGLGVEVETDFNVSVDAGVAGSADWLEFKSFEVAELVSLADGASNINTSSLDREARTGTGTGTVVTAGDGVGAEGVGCDEDTLELPTNDDAETNVEAVLVIVGDPVFSNTDDRRVLPGETEGSVDVVVVVVVGCVLGFGLVAFGCTGEVELRGAAIEGAEEEEIEDGDLRWRNKPTLSRGVCGEDEEMVPRTRCSNCIIGEVDVDEGEVAGFVEVDAGTGVEVEGVCVDVGDCGIGVEVEVEVEAGCGVACVVDTEEVIVNSDSQGVASADVAFAEVLGRSNGNVGSTLAK